MKIGFRIPSIKKRIAARISWKRIARNELGIKAPRGWGWLTNPKKAAYNRIDNRTSIGCGTLILLALAVVILFVTISSADERSIGPIDDSFFSNRGTEVIVEVINSAKSEILVQAYSFTSKSMTDAIIEASKRGVKIEVILDKSQKPTSATFLANSGIQVYIDKKHSIANNMVIIIDRSTAITDFPIYEKSEKKSGVEKLLIIRDNKQLLYLYIKNFEEHKGHSELYRGK